MWTLIVLCFSPNFDRNTWQMANKHWIKTSVLNFRGKTKAINRFQLKKINVTHISVSIDWLSVDRGVRHCFSKSNLIGIILFLVQVAFGSVKIMQFFIFTVCTKWLESFHTEQLQIIHDITYLISSIASFSNLNLHLPQIARCHCIFDDLRNLKLWTDYILWMGYFNEYRIFETFFTFCFRRKFVEFELKAMLIPLCWR